MYQNQIQRGMKLLTDDDIMQIDPSTLKMSDPCRCVLGQVNGYTICLTEMGLDTDRAARAHGFMLPYGNHDQYDQLTAEWKQAIAERRALIEARRGR
jgi:hypothetical protein